MSRLITLLSFLILMSISLESFSQDSQDDFTPILAKTIKKAILKEEPDSISKTKLTIPINSQIYVFSENDIDGYLKVIDIKTNKLGYVRKSVLKKIKDLPLSKSNSFQESGQSSSEEPEVVIKNTTSLSITLIVGDSYVSLSPHSSKTDTIQTGELNYTASAPGVLPLSGRHTFKGNSRYTWTFSIRTSYK